MHIFWRIIATLSLVFISFVIGAWLGGQFFVPVGSGLAGGAIVFSYGLGASLITLVLSLWGGSRLSPLSLKRTALISLLLVAMLAVLVGIRINQQTQAQRDPESSYLPINSFTVMMDRLDRSDPYLFIKMEVDADERSWQMTGSAPGNQICTGTVRANILLEMQTALQQLMAMDNQSIESCRATGGDPVVKKLSWNLSANNFQATTQPAQPPLGLTLNDSLEITYACATSYPVIAQAFARVEAASQSQTSGVKCR